MRLALLLITVLPLSATAWAQEDVEPSESDAVQTAELPIVTRSAKRLVFDESDGGVIVGEAANPGLSLLTTRQTVDIDVQPTFEVDLIKEIARAVDRSPF